MCTGRIRGLVTALVAGLVGALLVAPAPASAASNAQGVTKDEIKIALLVPDVDGLRAQGLSLPPKLTTEQTIKRAKAYVDAYGKINGREVVLEPVTWNPLDVTTFNRACIEATQDKKPFMVVNGTAYRLDAIPCIAIDNKTPMFFGEQASLDLIKESGKNLVTLGVPSEVMGATTAQYASKAQLAPKSAKIGILSANEPQVKGAADALEKQLKKEGYDVAKKVEINSLSRDNTVINTESQAAVGTFQAAGVDTVFVAIGPSQTTGYIQEQARTNAGFKTILVDTGFASCSTFAAQRMPVEFNGAPCLTTWDTRAVATKDGVKKDNALEAKCRKAFDASTGSQSTPGSPSGGLTAQGQTWDEDLSPNECTLMSVLLPALKAAGKDITWDKVYANLMKTTSAPAAYMSEGKGGYGKNKPYFADKVHVQVFNRVPSTTPQDANGVTYGGCPLPLNCFVPQLVNGQEWFPIPSAATKG